MSSPTGSVTRCDASGRTLEVIHLGSVPVGPGTELADLLVPDAHEVLAVLLEELTAGLVLVPWRLRRPVAAGGSAPLVLVGAPEPDGRVVLGLGGSLAEVDAAIDAAGAALAPATLTAIEAALRAAQPLADPDATTALIDDLLRTTDDLVGVHRQLAGANVELARVDERRSQLMGMVAHDLRNPLGSITGFALSLRHHLGTRLDDASRTLLDRIIDLGGQLLPIVDDLLDVSLLRHEGVVLTLAPVDLAAITADTIASHAPGAEHKQLRLAGPSVIGPVTVTGDERRLRQVLDNLVSNAIKYSRPGGQVTVELTQTEHEVRIEVRDEGVGIPREEQGRVFELFARTTARPTGGERSTGLGLPIAQRITQAHGGSIELTSTPGRGSRFSVVLPRHGPTGTARIPVTSGVP